MTASVTSAETADPRTGSAVSAGSEAATADPERFEAVQALEASFAELMTVFRSYLANAAERVHPGMLPGTFKVLSTISRSGAITLSALADRLTADKGLISRSVSELEVLGLIARTPDPDDRRSRLIAVTPEGAERLAAAREPHHGRLFAVLEDWNVADIRHVTVLMHALAAGETPEA
ncbi:MarR family winged helix-turn-helix transcriptional regulator [Microbacterium sp. P04]|uniref:MarR family winged helix-turn-helix transcriptional regulator n=1 Tax=Microbacterium sp. P04 TaxID=3366947 RepID=UPI003745F126